MRTTINTPNTERTLRYFAAAMMTERNRRGLSLKQMGKLCGIVQSHYDSLERMESPMIPLTRIIDIADRLGLSLGNLLPPEMLQPLTPPPLPEPVVSTLPEWVGATLEDKRMTLLEDGVVIHPNSLSPERRQQLADEVTENTRPHVGPGSNEWLKRLQNRESPAVSVDDLEDIDPLRGEVVGR